VPHKKRAPATDPSARGNRHELAARHVSQGELRSLRVRAGVRMIWFVMEAMLAVVLFLLIIWWTMPRKPRRGPDKKE
jgi:hypothetical protein